MAETVPRDAIQRLLLHLPNRRRVFDAITARPGAHVRWLSRHLGLALGTVEHHVRQLERHGLIFSHQAGRRRTYYATGQVDIQEAPLWHALRKPLWATLLRGLLRHEACAVTELAAAVGLPRTTASYHLRRMQEQGLVQRFRVGRESLYVACHRARLDRLLRAGAKPHRDRPDAAFHGVVTRARRQRVLAGGQGWVTPLVRSR